MAVSSGNKLKPSTITRLLWQLGASNILGFGGGSTQRGPTAIAMAKAIAIAVEVAIEIAITIATAIAFHVSCATCTPCIYTHRARETWRDRDREIDREAYFSIYEVHVSL